MVAAPVDELMVRVAGGCCVGTVAAGAVVGCAALGAFAVAVAVAVAFTFAVAFTVAFDDRVIDGAGLVDAFDELFVLPRVVLVFDGR